MRSLPRNRVTATAGAVLALLAFGPAPAALAETADPGLPTLGGAPDAPPPPGWVGRCEAPSRAAPLECRIEQRAVLAQTGQLVVAVTVRVPGDTRKPELIVRLPLGLSLAGGVTLDVDGAGGRGLPLETCDGGGCYATAPLPADLLAAMVRGDKLDVIFQSLSKAPIRLPMSLAGFSDAYDKIK